MSTAAEHPPAAATTLAARAVALFREGLARTAGRPRLGGLAGELQGALDRVHQPMRVAVVGRIKTGKSTFLNALLGEPLLATGTEELTFNVNRLRYHPTPSLLVRFKDGRPPEPRSLKELEGLTRRREEHREYLSGIRCIDVYHPNELLRSFDLVDTPGLRSFFGQDARNTLEFLGLGEDEVEAATQREAAGADAVLYLFQGAASESDRDVAAELRGPLAGRLTPVNAIGVLTMVDTFWGQGGDPAADGARLVRRHADDPQLRPVFYDVYPAAGLLGLGAQRLDDDAFAALGRLAALPAERLRPLLMSARSFCVREHDDVPVPAGERAALWDALGQYGCWLACTLLRERPATGRPELQEHLLEASGIPRVRRVVLSHFGNRALVIKLSAAVQRVAAHCHQEKQRLEGDDRRAVEAVAGAVERFSAQEHAFAEQDVLRSHYQGKLDFSPDEAAQLLAVTGEHGTSLRARLALEPAGSADLPAMAAEARARMRYWQVRASEYLAPGETVRAARILTRSFERILHTLHTLERQLDP